MRSLSPTSALEKQVAQVYRSLEPEERAHAAILTTNVGEAAALEVYGRQDALPPVLCGQNQYFLWGDHGVDENVIIHVTEIRLGDVGLANRSR
jgi:hypothetical protein